jgi:hypothetical protein
LWTSSYIEGGKQSGLEITVETSYGGVINFPLFLVGGKKPINNQNNESTRLNRPGKVCLSHRTTTHLVRHRVQT